MSLSEMKLAAEENNDLKSGQKSAWYKVSCVIQRLPLDTQNNPKPMFYHACTVCKKKVSEDHAGFRCENCQRTYQDSNLSYNFSMQVSDFSD